MSDFLRRAARRARRTLGGRQTILAHSWRSVEAGPLAGLQFYLPSDREAAWAGRFLSGQYEPEMLAALAELAGKGGVLYDIGAHIGFYTCAWLRLGGEHIEAFEPSPYNRELLQATVERNGMSGQVRIHAIALGDKEGRATLVASSLDVGASSAAYIPELGKADLPTSAAQTRLPGLTRISVAVRRLDDMRGELGLPTPAVLKLDVEGAEGAVLAGAARLLEEAHPAILCEIHNAETGLKIAHSLAALGYDMHTLGNNGPHPAYLWVQR